MFAHRHITSIGHAPGRRKVLINMIQISLALGLSGLSSAGEGAPLGAETATPADLSRDQVVYDTGAARGMSAADVPVSGTTDAPDGRDIEVRAVTETGAAVTGWTVVSTASGGAWFGSLSVPRNVNWCRIQARAAGSSGISETVNRFAAGHVWDWWDQSNTHKLLQYNSNDEGYKEPAGYVDGDIQYASRDAADADNDVGTYVLLRSIVDGASKMPPGMQAMANAFAEARPGEKLMVRIHTLSGTSPHDSLTTLAEDATYSANGIRDWNDELLIDGLDNSDGQYPGLVVVAGWHEWNSANANTPGVFSKYFLSKDLDGNAVLPANENLPRFFDAANGGLYDWTKSRFFYMGPHGYASYSDPNTALPAASAVTDKAQLKGSTWTGDGEYAGLVTNARRLGDANTPEALPYRATTAGASRGFWDGTARDSQHMSSSFDGQVRHMRIQMHHILAAQGLITTQEPEIDYRYDDPAGAYVDFGILGRNITTERLRRAAVSELGSYPATIPDLSSYGATLSPTLDHRTEVMGITINSLSASRAEIQAGAGPSGEDVIRVYAEPGKTLSWQDAIGFGTGALPGYEVPEDFLDGVWLNWPVVDVPSPILPAIPVSHQGNDLLPSANAPELWTVDGGTAGTIFSSYVDGDLEIGSGRTSVRFEIVGSLAMETNTRYGLAHIHSGNAELFVDIGGALVLTTPAGNITTADDTIVANQVYDIAAVVDLANDVAYIEVDGVRLEERLGTLGLSGTFTGTRNAAFLRRTSNSASGARAKGAFTSLKMWLNDADGTGATWKTVEGDAATVNADPWKTGGDAV